MAASSTISLRRFQFISSRFGYQVDLTEQYVLLCHCLPVEIKSCYQSRYGDQWLNKASADLTIPHPKIGGIPLHLRINSRQQAGHQFLWFPHRTVC
jgi:hypothetical protein